MHFLLYFLFALQLFAGPRMDPNGIVTMTDPPDNQGGGGVIDPPDNQGGGGAIDPPDNQGGG